MVGEICASTDISLNVSDEVPSTKLALKAPSFALVEKHFKVSGTTEGASQTVYIMLQKEAWGVDWFSRDEKLAEMVSNLEGKFETELQLESIGFNKIYAVQKQEWLGVDWFGKDIKSPIQNILTLNYFIIGGLGLAILLIMYKKGVFKKLGGK